MRHPTEVTNSGTYKNRRVLDDVFGAKESSFLKKKSFWGTKNMENLN